MGTLFLCWFILSWSRSFLSHLLIAHLIENSFLVRVIYFFLFETFIDRTFDREVIYARTWNFGMDSKIVVKIAAFFCRFSFRLFFFLEWLVFGVEVLLFDMITFDSKAEDPCGSGVCLPDSEHRVRCKYYRKVYL
jgi:hypothetical protein